MKSIIFSLLIYFLFFSITVGGELASSLPSFSKKPPVYISSKIITNVKNLIGIAPKGAPVLDQSHSFDMRGLETIMFKGQTGFANWIPISISVINVTTNKRIFIDQVSIERISHDDLYHGEYIKVFDVYTGSYDHPYNFFNIELNSERNLFDVISSSFNSSKKANNKVYYELPPKGVERFFISVTGKDIGSYSFRIKIIYTINKMKMTEYVDNTFRLTVLKGNVHRSGIWARAGRMGEKVKTYTIQLGAFKTKENAQALYEKIKINNYNAYLVDGDGVTKVRVGIYDNKYNLNIDKNKLENIYGISSFIIETDDIPRHIICADRCD